LYTFYVYRGLSVRVKRELKEEALRLGSMLGVLLRELLRRR